MFVDDVTDESTVVVCVDESSKLDLCLTQEELESRLRALFTVNGGMRHRTKYQYLMDEERSYVKSLNLMSIWYMMPYGYKGSHGINKRLRGRILHNKWRPLLLQGPKGNHSPYIIIIVIIFTHSFHCISIQPK